MGCSSEITQHFFDYCLAGMLWITFSAFAILHGALSLCVHSMEHLGNPRVTHRNRLTLARAATWSSFYAWFLWTAVFILMVVRIAAAMEGEDDDGEEGNDDVKFVTHPGASWFLMIIAMVFNSVSACLTPRDTDEASRKYSCGLKTCCSCLCCCNYCCCCGMTLEYSSVELQVNPGMEPAQQFQNVPAGTQQVHYNQPQPVYYAAPASVHHQL